MATRNIVGNILELAELRPVLQARIIFNHGVIMGKTGDSEGAIRDLTAVIDMDGAGAGGITLALTGRGQARNERGDTEGQLDDQLRAAQHPDASTELRFLALQCAFAALRSNKDDSKLNRVFHQADQTLSELDEGQRVEALTQLFRGLATEENRKIWLTVWKRLAQTQPENVVEKLAPFQPVAQILETGDISLLDPLAPHERAFAQRVLAAFGNSTG